MQTIFKFSGMDRTSVSFGRNCGSHIGFGCLASLFSDNKWVCIAFCTLCGSALTTETQGIRHIWTLEDGLFVKVQDDVY